MGISVWNKIILWLMWGMGLLVWGKVILLTQEVKQYISKKKLGIRMYWGVLDHHFYNWFLFKHPEDDDTTLQYKKKIRILWIVGMIIFLLILIQIRKVGI